MSGMKNRPRRGMNGNRRSGGPNITHRCGRGEEVGGAPRISDGKER